MQFFRPRYIILIMVTVEIAAAENDLSHVPSYMVTTSTRARKFNFYSTSELSTTADNDATSSTNLLIPPHEFPKNMNESKGKEIKLNATLESPIEPPPREFPTNITNSDLELVNELQAKTKHNVENDKSVESTTAKMVYDLPQHFLDEMAEYELQEQIRKVQLKPVEMIEDERKTEDVLRQPHVQVPQQKSESAEGVPLVQGKLAAILAGVFVCISICAYIGLLTWRRYLERRYGNRELIVENEFGNDLEYFSI